MPPVVLAIGKLRWGHPLNLGVLDLQNITEAASRDSPKVCTVAKDCPQKRPARLLLETLASLLKTVGWGKKRILSDS